METSDNNATSSPASVPDNSRRRSGRVVRAPQKFSPQPNASQNDHSSKRKRGPEHDDEDAENGYPEEAEEEEELSDPEDEDDDADEAPSRSKTKSKRSRPKKPAVKRAKVNGSAPVDAASAPHAPAVKLPNRPKKTARVVIAHPDGDGLYGESEPWDLRILISSTILTRL